MIYLYHTPICAVSVSSTPSLQKQALANHRHQLLNEFCQYQNLPMPIYDKSIHGKPFVKNIPNLHFNQSHCQSHYALIYSLTVANIGVDIENISRNLNFDKLAKRYFHLDEYQYWQDNGYDGALWFKLWTIKEAVLKASGLGIRLSLNELNANFITDNSGLVLHDKIGKFYFKNMVMDSTMMTIAYPSYYGDVDIIFS